MPNFCIESKALRCQLNINNVEGSYNLYKDNDLVNVEPIEDHVDDLDCKARVDTSATQTFKGTLQTQAHQY